MIVDLPLPLNRGNARLHWATMNRQKKKYMNLCTILKANGHLPKPPRMPPLKSVITCHVIVGAQMDDDNLMARLKWPIDWMVKWDYLRGDSPDYLVWGSKPTQEVKRKVSYRAIFTIEPAEE